MAAHPDDEVLGPGGSIAKLSASGSEVHVVIVTRGQPPLFPEELVETGRTEANAAQKLLGVASTFFLDFPAAGLDSVPHRDVNAAMGEVFTQTRPEAVFVPFNGDLHLDHQCSFLSAMVCARPNASGAPSAIYAYETLSETNWNAPYLTPGFTPNVFVDITEHIETKLQAMTCYASQLQPFPHERSIEALRALAQVRGATVGVHAAEALVLIRGVE